MSFNAFIEHLDSINHLLGIASTIYLPGCSLRCPYCFNMDIVNNKNLKTYEWEEFKKYLQKNKSGHFVLTGGEPTYNRNFEKIVDFINTLNPKSIQINTNMLQPDKISWFLRSVKVPVVAFDFKTTIRCYGEMKPQINDCEKKIIGSLFILKKYIEDENPNLNIQCRTTLYKNLDLEKILEMSEMLDVVNCENFTWNFQDIYPKMEINSEIVKDWMKKISKDFNLHMLHNQEEVIFDNQV